MVVSTQARRVSLYIAAALCTLVVSLSYWFGLFDTLQAQLTDRFFVTEQVSTDIVIIDIDEESLSAIGQWPWPRAVHAQLLENIPNANRIGFDVLFTEPSGLGVSDDEVLIKALTQFNGTAVLAAVVDEQSGRITYPIEMLRENSTVGLVNTAPDRDGIVRHSTLRRNEVESFDIVMSGTSPALDSMRIYYHGPAKTYTTISYYDVYSGAVPSEVLVRKTILVGASAAGLGDSYQTPFGTMSGVEIHANAIETLQLKKYIIDVSSFVGLLLLVLIAAVLLLAFQFIRSTLRLSVLLAVIGLSILGASHLAFTGGYIIPHLYLLILCIAEGGVLLLLQYLFETKEKHFIRSSFEHYVAPEVIEELYTQPGKLGLGGETRTVSILFSDIRGFTTLSEKLTPQQLMEQLNEYLEEMSEAIMQNQGLVDKYIGDAVMAFWGAPLSNEQHALDACESVLTITKALQTLNLKWASEGRPQFAIGIGISSGEVVVGNMGSRRRFNYSIIGDEVNFTARIEGLTKIYGVACIIGESTYEVIAHVTHLPTRLLDEVMVKGKTQPRRIYELITFEVTETTKQGLEQFSVGRKHYQAGEFAPAMKYFTAALVLIPNDRPSQLFLERCEQLLLTPPKSWNGVFEFTTK